jgi:hypothetical protein
VSFPFKFRIFKTVLYRQWVGTDNRPCSVTCLIFSLVALAIFLQSSRQTVILFCIKERDSLRAQKWGAVKAHLTRDAALMVCVYALLFIGVICKGIYLDHLNLVKTARAVKVEANQNSVLASSNLQSVKNDLNGQIVSWSQRCAKDEGVSETLQKQNGDQQNTINNCQTEAMKLLTPESQKITVLTWEDKVVNGTDHEASYLLLTNRIVTPVRIDGSCDVSITAISADPIGIGTYSGGASVIGRSPSPTSLRFNQQREQSRTQFSVSFSLPAWTPTSPIRMRVSYTSLRTAGCNFIVR